MGPSLFATTPTSASLSPEEYNEKVYYCRSCHSLHILVDDSLADGDWDGSYCAKCGSTQIGQCAMGEWLDEEDRRKATRKEIEWNK